LQLRAAEGLNLERFNARAEEPKGEPTPNPNANLSPSISLPTAPHPTLALTLSSCKKPFRR
jgi:hypothetical protein